MAAWLETPQGQCLLRWQQQVVDRCVSDAFGYHALQLGGLHLPALQANRMPNHWRVEDTGAWQDLVELPGDEARPELGVPLTSWQTGEAAMFTDARALPFAEGSMDLVVLPHTLEFNPHPQACLSEVMRVLVNEGQLVVLGINPLSLWGAQHWRDQLWQRVGWGSLYLPERGVFLTPWHVAQCLRMLGFVVTDVVHGCHQTAARSAGWLARQAWLNALGGRFWPMLGAAYCLTAVKRVEGATLLGKPWGKAPVATGSKRAKAAPQSRALRDPES